jgi:alkanesulfonate monooxygenase SsuD/methylene tetrahydromethanopterin reductase-like flavin-dependent oxidoreductase (luciferase family)
VEWGIALGALADPEEVLEGAIIADKAGAAHVWLIDFPSSQYSTVMAASVADKISCRIGVGLLSPLLYPGTQIARALSTLAETYGERFDLLIGAGDRLAIKSTGSGIMAGGSVIETVETAVSQIRGSLEGEGHRCTIWVGAQGPKMIASARSGDGVLLNHSDPEVIEWALGVLGPTKKGYRIGVFPPSCVHEPSKPALCDSYRYAAAIVGTGMSRATVTALGLGDNLDRAIDLVKSKKGIDKEVIETLGDDLLNRFGVHSPPQNIQEYLRTLEGKGVDTVVFGPPIDRSPKYVQRLVGQLQN